MEDSTSCRSATSVEANEVLSNASSKSKNPPRSISFFSLHSQFALRYCEVQFQWWANRFRCIGLILITSSLKYLKYPCIYVMIRSPRSVHDCLRIDVEGLRFSRTSASGMRLPTFFNNRRTYRFYRGEKKRELTPSLSRKDCRTPVLVRNPSALSDTSIRISSFICANCLLEDFSRI